MYRRNVLPFVGPYYADHCPYCNIWAGYEWYYEKLVKPQERKIVHVATEIDNGSHACDE